MGAVEVSEANGAWSFAFGDGLVTEIRVGFRFVLVLNDALIGIEQPFLLWRGGQATLVPPGEAVHEVAAALPLFNQRILHATASHDAKLRIAFENGSMIEVGTDPSGLYEGWQIELPHDRVWVGIGQTIVQPTSYHGTDTDP